MTPTAHERALQAARALRERQPATLLLWRSLGNLSHGLLLPAAAILMLIALVTFSPADPAWSHTSNATDVVYQNQLGVYGAWFSDVALWLFGKLAFALPILLLLCSAHYWATYKVRLVPVYVGFATLIVRWLGFTFAFCSVLLCGSLMAHALVPDAAIRTAWQGIAGSGLSTAVLSLGPPAAFFVVMGLVSLSVTMLFERSYTWLLDLLGWPFVVLFEKLTELVSVRDSDLPRANYERDDDFEFDLDRFEAQANVRVEPEFSIDDDLSETSKQRFLAEVEATTSLSPLSAAAAHSQPASRMATAGEGHGEPTVTAEQNASIELLDTDEDELAGLAASQRIGVEIAAEAIPVAPDLALEIETDAPLEPVFDEALFNDAVSNHAANSAQALAADPFDIDVELAREREIAIDLNIDGDEEFATSAQAADLDATAALAPAFSALDDEAEVLLEHTGSAARAPYDDELDRAAPISTANMPPQPAAVTDPSAAALAAQRFTLDPQAIANMRLHYSDTQSLAPLLSTQTLRMQAQQAALDQADVDVGSDDDIDAELAATVALGATQASVLAAELAEAAQMAIANEQGLGLSAGGDYDPLDELLADDIPTALAQSPSVTDDAQLAAASVGAPPVQPALDLSQPLAAVSSSAVAAAVAEPVAPAVDEAESAAIAAALTELHELAATQIAPAVQLPPVLEDTLSGPLQAIPLLDQTLIEPLAETATGSFRVEVDEFSHVDYDDEVYSSPVKRTEMRHNDLKRSADLKRSTDLKHSQGVNNFAWLNEAADSLSAVSDALADTALVAKTAEQAQVSTVGPAGLGGALAADIDDEQDSLAAALDALAQTSMFRAEPIVTPPANAQTAPAPSLASTAIEDSVSPEVNADAGADADASAQSVTTADAALLPPTIEAQLAQTAKLLAADLAQTLQQITEPQSAAPLASHGLSALPMAENPASATSAAPQAVAPSKVAEPSPGPLAIAASAPTAAAAETAQPPVAPASAFSAGSASADFTAAQPVQSTTAQPTTPAPAAAQPMQSTPLRQHPQAGPVIPVNPALAASLGLPVAPAAAASASTATAPLADTINFSAARPANMHGNFAAPTPTPTPAAELPVASADKHSLDIFAADPSVRRLSYNCATAVQVGDVGLPSVNLLRRMAEHERKGFSEEKLLAMAKLLEEKLADFGVEIKVANVLPGPVITRFDVMPAPGIKASRISGLSTDLARSLAVTSVRVLEVIPGTSCVGIEVPNAEREMVYLGDVLHSDEYQAAEDPLTLALGYDISGQPAVANLGKMPHLLVAGTTGSGKSVGVNTMLLSMLFKASPEDVRLILVDPKFLELSVYERIPHLLTPVITDMNLAANALRWAVGEMERRYQLMSKLGVRNLAGYNQKVLAAEQAGSPLEDPIWQVDPDDTSASKYVRPYLCKLPSIVIVIDEFADMMMIAGKKCETLITRIAQKARAAGIHLILATQRPSVDVITGLIKANIPSRIAFTVSTKIDSRTILDQSGAEELLGAGDMLYAPSNSRTVMRVHGAFVSDDEVHAVISDWCSRAEPNYLHSILEEQCGVSVPGLADEVPAGDGNNQQDVLYDQVLDFILTTRKASISAVQRRFGIGYNRSAKIIESMEAAGILGPAGTGAGNSRDILIGSPDD